MSKAQACTALVRKFFTIFDGFWLTAAEKLCTTAVGMLQESPLDIGGDTCIKTFIRSPDDIDKPVTHCISWKSSEHIKQVAVLDQYTAIGLCAI